jgi:hypothetical protein
VALFKTIQASLYLIVVWSRMVEEENQVQDEAVKAARQSLAVAMNEYKAGIVSYFNVLVVHVIALNKGKTAIDIQGRRMECICPTLGRKSYRQGRQTSAAYRDQRRVNQIQRALMSLRDVSNKDLSKLAEKCIDWRLFLV